MKYALILVLSLIASSAFAEQLTCNGFRLIDASGASQSLNVVINRQEFDPQSGPDLVFDQQSSIPVLVTVLHKLELNTDRPSQWEPLPGFINVHGRWGNLDEGKTFVQFQGANLEIEASNGGINPNSRAYTGTLTLPGKQPVKMSCR